MKIASHTQEELRAMVKRLRELQGTRDARRYDKRYIKAYEKLLNN